MKSFRKPGSVIVLVLAERGILMDISKLQNKPAARTDSRRRNSTRRTLLHLLGVSAVAGLCTLFSGKVAAQESIKVGLVMPLTGVLGPAGKQAVAGARLYMAQHGDIVAGR